MSHSVYDLTKGIDITGLPTVSGGDLNNLIDAATPYTDKGLILWSVDTAAGVPDVPDAAATTKWKRYIWVRIPHTSVVPPANTVPYFYAWNDTATSVATYLKWQRIEADFTTVNALIAALQAELDASQLDITAATNTANAANSTAGTAATDATNALANAAIVAGNLATLNAQVNHVTTGLAPTKAIADSALSLATAAVTPAQLTAVSTTITTLTTNVSMTESALFAVDLATTKSFAHGSATIPKNVQWMLVCVTTEHGYAVGEEVDVSAVNGTSGNTYPCFIPTRTAANLSCFTASYTPHIIRRSDSTAQYITPASWRLKCYYAKG